MSNNAKLYKCYKGTCSKCLNEEDPYITEDEYKELLDADGKVQCPEGHLDCGIQELKPEDYPKPPSDNKKLFLIVGGLLGVLLIVGAVFMFSGKSKSVAHTGIINNPVAVKEAEPVDKHALTVEKTSSVKEPVKEPTVNKVETGKVEKTGTVIDPPIESKTKIITTLNFPFGHYKGETVNDLMHGNGTLYFSQNQIISSKDPKKRIAEAGDNVNGTWYEGYLDQGKWFSKSGEIKGVINIGH